MRFPICRAQQPGGRDRGGIKANQTMRIGEVLRHTRRWKEKETRWIWWHVHLEFGPVVDDLKQHIVIISLGIVQKVNQPVVTSVRYVRDVLDIGRRFPIRSRAMPVVWSPEQRNPPDALKFNLRSHVAGVCAPVGETGEMNL